MRLPTVLVFAAAALGLSGCYTARSEARSRAANEFGCDSYQLEVTDQGDGTYRVDGCGRSAVFACVGPAHHRGGLFYGATTSCVREGSVDFDDPITLVPERPRPGGFDDAAVRRDIAPQLDAAVEECRSRRGPHGMAEVKMTFERTGEVSSVSLDTHFDGTDVASCLKSKLGAVTIAPFRGDRETLHVDLDIPGAETAASR